MDVTVPVSRQSTSSRSWVPAAACDRRTARQSIARLPAGRQPSRSRRRFCDRCIRASGPLRLDSQSIPPTTGQSRLRLARRRMHRSRPKAPVVESTAWTGRTRHADRARRADPLHLRGLPHLPGRRPTARVDRRRALRDASARSTTSASCPCASHSRLEAWLREHPVGEVYAAPLDVILSDVDVVEPDLLFVSERARARSSASGSTARPISSSRSSRRARDARTKSPSAGCTSASACASTGLWMARSTS